MKTQFLLIQAVAMAKQHGFKYVRDNILWPLRYAGKITDAQLLTVFAILHKKGF